MKNFLNDVIKPNNREQLVQGITTIKIGWCEIGSNFQLVSIIAN